MIEVAAWIVGILALLVGIPTSYLITLRLAKLHSKKMAAGGRGAGNSGTQPSGSTANDQSLEPGWYSKHWASIALVLAGAAIFFWGLYTPGLKADAVGSWSWSNWFPILILAGIVLVLARLNAKALGELVGTVRTGVVVALFLLFFGFPAWTWITSNSSSGCVSEHPCVLSQDNDSSSAVVKVRDGQLVCFEPWMLKHLDEVGMMVSFQDPQGPGEPFPCSREQIVTGSCTAVYDRFWFKPPKKTRLPNYWFVAVGKKC